MVNELSSLLSKGVLRHIFLPTIPKLSPYSFDRLIPLVRAKYFRSSFLRNTERNDCHYAKWKNPRDKRFRKMLSNRNIKCTYERVEKFGNDVDITTKKAGAIWPPLLLVHLFCNSLIWIPASYPPQVHSLLLSHSASTAILPMTSRARSESRRTASPKEPSLLYGV